MGLSIIIPTHNRIPNLTKLVNSIYSFNLPFEFEVIVVNDNKELHSTIYLNTLTKLLFNTIGGAASSRNLGASNAKYNYFLFIDDDMIVSKDSIVYIYTELTKDENISYNVDWTYPLDLLNIIKKKAFGRYLINNNHTTLKGWMKEGDWIKNQVLPIEIIASAFLGISKINFDKIRGYDSTFPFAGFEDYDFAKRLNNNGINGILNTQITVFHNEEDNVVIDKWLERRYRKGYTNAIGVKKLGYVDHMLRYSNLKSFLFEIIYDFRNLYKFILRLIPNNKLFDKTYSILFNPLLGSYIYKGYYDGMKNE